MIGEDHLHTIQKRAVQEYSPMAHRTLIFQSQKKHYQYKPKTVSLKDMTQTIQLQMSGNQTISFF